jgi:hypothetical protein
MTTAPAMQGPFHLSFPLPSNAQNSSQLSTLSFGTAFPCDLLQISIAQPN